ncbi:MAG: cytochrome c oxidase subunit II [Chloroflexota bacterium]|nr:cytochrome c oxidase subunit II [Chloroflexota bacterium]
MACALLPAASGCRSIDSFNTVTPQGHSVEGLFTLELILASLVSGAVALAAFYAMFRFRERPGAPEPAQIHGNTKLELAWTAAPVLLLVVLFVLTVRTMSTVEAEVASPLRVQVIGHQWWWEYVYPDLGIVTANELHVPVGQPVRLELTSADVVHNFWVPQFGWKKDNTPNHVTTMNVVVTQPGVYDGACSEFCGTQHAWMRIRAVATPPDQFGAWVARNQQPAPAAVPRGQQVFQQHTCINCHAIQGVSDARVGPDLSHFGSRTTIGAGVLDNTPENLRAWLVDPQRIKPGVLMPGYPSLPEDDLRALVDYLEGLK